MTIIEGWDTVIAIELCETKQEYHKRRAREEVEIIKLLYGKYGYGQPSRAEIKRARKRMKYHERMARNA